MRYFAMIHGGVGPDVWDREFWIDAVDFRDAADQAIAEAESQGGEVYQLEQQD